MDRGRRKTRVGRVVSDKMDKTVVVAVEWRQAHPLYRKQVKRVTKFHVHDEENKSKIGDWVNIMETRPLSKTKRWRVTQVLSTGEPAPTEEVLGLSPEELGQIDDEVEEATEDGEEQES
jgi:small subunit ribosomal protein S17